MSRTQPSSTDQRAPRFGPGWPEAARLHSRYHEELIALQTQILERLGGDLTKAREVWRQVSEEDLEALPTRRARLLVRAARRLLREL